MILLRMNQWNEKLELSDRIFIMSLHFGKGTLSATDNRKWYSGFASGFRCSVLCINSFVAAC